MTGKSKHGIMISPTFAILSMNDDFKWIIFRIWIRIQIRISDVKICWMLEYFPTVWHSSTRRADKSYFSQLTDWRTPVVVLLRLLQQSNPIARSRKLKGSWFKDSLLYFPHCQAKQLSFIVWLYQKTFWRKANLVSSQEPWGNFYVNQDI